MPSDVALAKYRSAVAMEMRMQGTEYADIAKELGFADKSGAWRAVNRELRRRTARAHELYVLTRLEAVDRTLRAFGGPALAGGLTSIDHCVIAIDERARLIGLC